MAGMLPVFVNEFQAVTIRVARLGREIAWFIVKLCTGRMYLNSPCLQGCGMGGNHLGFGMCGEADMYRIRCGPAVTQPKEYPAIRAEPLQIRMPVLAVIIMAHRDSDGR